MNRADRWLRSALLVNAALYLGAGLGLSFAPGWFFTHLAPFAPFNRHYAGDTGIFSAALGATLLVAAHRPRQHAALILIGIAAGLAHSLNHLIDHLRLGHGRAELLADLLPLLLPALLLLATLPFVRPRPSRRSARHPAP